MKMKNTCFILILAIVLSLPAFTQYTPAPDTVAKPGIKQQDKESMMGKPTFQATSGDLLFSIWIITQEEHKKMMPEMSEKGMDKETNMNMDMKGMKAVGMKDDSGSMKGKGMSMDKATKESMMTGTHHMMDDSGSMKGKGMSMDDATREVMMAGTHHMMVEVKNTLSGKETNAISSKVEIVTPTNKNSTVDLKMPMKNHFGSGLTLDEKGDYLLTVSVLVGNVSKTIKLKYTVM